jgi:hypothetical protein
MIINSDWSERTGDRWDIQWGHHTESRFLSSCDLLVQRDSLMLLQRAKLMVADLEMWRGRLLDTVHLALPSHLMAWLISFMRFHCQAPRHRPYMFYFPRNYRWDMQYCVCRARKSFFLETVHTQIFIHVRALTFINICHILPLWVSIKDWADLILRFMKLVIKNISLSRIIRRKCNTYVKSVIWIWMDKFHH